MTPAVRKILQSQKTFANHLADEEAFRANQSLASASTAMATPIALQRQASSRVTRTPASNSKRAPTAASTPLPDASEHKLSPSAVVPTPTFPSGYPLPSEGTVSAVDPDDSHPLLSVNVPRLPSPATIERLITAPPLSYNAALVAPSTSTAPPRQFCEICGYWGRVKCMKCGARVCGLECKNAHDESRCLRFYA